MLPETYRTFTRSCTNWEEYASARKTSCSHGLSVEEARSSCDRYNKNRTASQIRRGTKMEFESE